MRAQRRAAVMTVLVALFAVLLVRRTGGARVTTVVDDLATLAAAMFATGAAAWRATRLQGRARASWALMASGFGAAALGEGIWGWFELVAHRDTPFPSVADVAYLTFPVLALLALLLRPSPALLGQGRLRTVLDGLLVAGSLFNISWVTALGAVYGAGGDGGLAFGIGLAYPASDVILVTVTLVLLAQARTRQGLGLLAAGLMAQALSDSAYSYFSANGSYQSGNLLDIGYFAGYLLLAESALRDRSPDSVAEGRQASVLSMLLPYLPAAAGVGIAVWQLRPGLSNPPVMVGSGLVAVLFIRQLLMLLDNRALVRKVLAQQGELRHQAFHDPLTSLANRALFNDRLAHAVQLHGRDLRPVAVLLADLDDFKSVNDSLGHPAGDELLIRVAERLRGATRAGDTVARLGGDEFAILVEDGTDAMGVAERILLALDQPVNLGSRQVPVGASIGIAVLDADASPLGAAELLKQADLAMYTSKRSGKGTATRYEPGSAYAASDELDLRADVMAAVGAGDIAVHYQPIFRIDGGLRGFEALARWSRHGVPVSPERFIGAAERAGVLRHLDEQVLATTLALASSVDDPARSLLFTINAGVEQLTDPALPARLAQLLADHGLRPDQLVVEVPENRLFDDVPASLAALERLRTHGIQLALDDFGVGWSSLARLQALPADIVKIDRCFVAPLEEVDAATDLIAGMIDLAHRVGAIVIAEGVEHPRQLEVLRRLGCDAVQGFLLGRPMAAPQAASLAASTLGPPLPAPRTGNESPEPALPGR